MSIFSVFLTLKFWLIGLFRFFRVIPTCITNVSIPLVAWARSGCCHLLTCPWMSGGLPGLLPLPLPQRVIFDKHPSQCCNYPLFACFTLTTIIKLWSYAWMNLETIILSKLTQEQKMKYRIFSLIGGCWTMRTHRHKERDNTTHQGLLWGCWGAREGRTLGQIVNLCRA